MNKQRISYSPIFPSTTRKKKQKRRKGKTWIVVCLVTAIVGISLEPLPVIYAEDKNNQIIGANSSTEINQWEKQQIFKIENSILTGYSKECQEQLVIIPQGVTEIAAHVFEENQIITDVIIPDSVVRIGEGAFKNCTSLKSVVIGKGVQTIETLAFEGCTSLVEISIPDGVKKLTSASFYGCSGLETVFLGDGLQELEEGVFYRCPSLRELYFGKSIQSIKNPFVFDDSQYYNKSPFYSGKINMHIQNAVAKNFSDSFPYANTIMDNLGLIVEAEQIVIEGIGKNIMIKTRIVPDYVYAVQTVFSSTNRSVLTVNSDGVVTTVGEGTAAIEVTAYIDGQEPLYGRCDITVNRKKKPVESILLNASLLTIKEGDTASLKATVMPQDADDTTVKWRSGDESIAKVKDGKIEAIKPGRVMITCYSNSNPSVEAFCVVEVERKAIPVTGLTLSYSKTRIEVGESLYLTATIIPNGADNPKTAWKSSNSDVAQIKEDGCIIGIAKGEAEITCYSLENPQIKSSVIIQVLEPVKKETSLICNDDAITLKKGQNYQLDYELWPVQNVTFSSDNPKVAIVSEQGLVTVVGKGIAVITIQAQDGTSAECKITGIIVPQKIKLNRKKIIMKVGAKYTLKASISPSNVSKKYKTVKWSSNNTKVVKVSKTGKIVAVGVGACTIKAKTLNGLTITCKIVVEKKS